MHKQLVVPVLIGLVVVVGAAFGILYMQRGAHIELKGSLLKIRTAPMDENSCVAVIDFRFSNPADYAFVVRKVEVLLEDAQGNVYQSTPVSEVDAKRLFEFFPLLGQKYNDTLLTRDKIPPKSTQDRMIAARFELPEARLEARKRLFVRVEDVDGPVSELFENK
jgi:hypothetical protein